ncbi:MAG: PIN domain-containing protein [Actinomycetota bacterium]|nr:PIN domain-containing protein [Actinomycetota bacterium]
MSLFVDTSAFYAAADVGDRSHARAMDLLRAPALVTSDHVLVESWVLLRARGGRAAAERFWDAMRGGLATIETVLPGDLEAAWQIGKAFPDQDFSIVDRTSFSLMERIGVTEVASFDDDFAIYRYGPRRDRAFDLKR